MKCQHSLAPVLGGVTVLMLISGQVEAEIARRVVINELRVKGNDEFVELYNATIFDVNLTGWSLRNQSGESLQLGGVIPPHGFVSPDLLGLGLDDRGDIASLLDDTGARVDAVGYGLCGGADIGPYGTGRYPDGEDTDDDAVDFNYLHSEIWITRGEPNVYPETALGSGLIINEIDIYGQCMCDTIELYNPTMGSVDPNGYRISDGDGYCLITGAPIVSPGDVLKLWATSHFSPAGCDTVDWSPEDVVYLYDHSGTKVDQLGFHGEEVSGTIQRCTDGQGPNNGWDFSSSGGGTTLRDVPSSLGVSNNYVCSFPSIIFVTHHPFIPEPREEVRIEAIVRGDSVVALGLVYRHQGGAWAITRMVSAGVDSYVAVVGAPAARGGLMEYLVEAEDTEGRVVSSDTKGFFAGTSRIASLLVNDADGRNVYQGFAVRVNGVATVGTGELGESNNNLFLQDAGGRGIGVSDSTPPDSCEAVRRCHYVQVCGTLRQDSGQVQLQSCVADSCLEVGGPGNCHDPAPFTIGELLSSVSIPEAREGCLVTISNVKPADDFPEEGRSGSVRVWDTPPDTLVLYIHKETDIDGTDPPACFDITGILTQHDQDAPYYSHYRLLPRDLDDIVELACAEGSADVSPIPLDPALLTFPNPFGLSTRICFSGAGCTPAVIRIFDVRGRLVRTLVDRNDMVAYHSLVWDGRDSSGKEVASGVYFCRLVTPHRCPTSRMIIVR